MEFKLSDRLRIDTEIVNGRGITRAYVGDRELRLSSELLGALLDLQRGARPTQAQLVLLVGQQVLTPTTSAATGREEGLQASSGFVSLAPTLAIDWSPAPRTQGSALVTPETSLPISLYVPPAALHALQQLAGALRSAWSCLLRAAHSRAQLVEPQAAERILVALAEDLVRSDTVLTELFIVQQEPFQLTPRQPLQVNALQYALEELQLYPDRTPLPGLRPLRWSIPPALLSTITHWFGWLGHGLPTSELALRLREAPGPVLQLFDALKERGLLTFSTVPPAMLTLQPGEIMHLGHATLLANLGGEYVLIDPWFPPASAADQLPPPTCAQLPPLAGIFLTHHHWDHVNLETLLKLRKDIPIYIPKQPEGSLLCPRTEQLLQHIGFENVRVLSHDESVPCGQGGAIVAAPFFGEDPTRLHYGANCYVLVHASQAALVHVDSSVDIDGRSLVTSGIAQALVQRFGPLSPLLATRRQERGMMIEHTWEFLLMPAPLWVKPTENCCNDASFLAALTTACQARNLVLYSEGGADFYPASTDFLRRPSSLRRMAPHEYLWDSLDVIKSAVATSGAALHLSNPYQRFRIGSDAVSPPIAAVIAQSERVPSSL